MIGVTSRWFASIDFYFVFIKLVLGTFPFKNKTNKLFQFSNSHASVESVHQARMRMGLSVLNSYRQKYTFVIRFLLLLSLSARRSRSFFHPQWTTQWLALMTDVSNVQSTIDACNCNKMLTLPLTTRAEECSFLEMVLFGHSCLPCEPNVTIFIVTQILLREQPALIPEFRS